MASSPLGPSRKGSPCLENISPGSTVVLADIHGSGVIGHIWMTVTDTLGNDPFVLRDLVLRMYWDGERSPSVEVPLGDFFCCGFGRACLVNSLPIVVNPTRGFNSFFQMPFGKEAKITLENQHEMAVPNFFYQIDYCLYDEIPKEMGHFHALFRRQAITEAGEDYVLLDRVRGKGKYVGTYLAVTAMERCWWGEGEIKFYLDGDREYPTLCGTGTEDYFGGAWSFATQKNGKTVENTYCTPFMGYPYYSAHDDLVSNPYHNDDCLPSRGLYRWHIPDPICFSQNLKVTIQQIGSRYGGLFERRDDVSSVAYWYQTEPHVPFAAFPSKTERRPR